MILGPLYRVELLRLARRGVHFRLRVVLAAVLLLGLLVTYLRTFPNTDLGGLLFCGTEDDASRLNKFGENFLLAFLSVQLAAVILITPVYAGGAIADEKERGGLDFLLTTPLTSWELVVGKLAARLTFVLTVLATGLPVLFLTLLFGGVSTERVLAGFSVSAVTAIAVSTFATMLSVYRHTLRDVLLWCYGVISLLVLFGFCFGSCAHGDVVNALSPVSVLWSLILVWSGEPRIVDPTWGLVGTFTAIYLTLSVLFLMAAIIDLRKRTRDDSAKGSTETPAGTSPEPVDDPPPAQSDAPPLPEWYHIPERPWVEDESRERFTAGRSFAVRPLGPDEDPFVWKERYFSGRLPLVESRWVTMIAGIAITAFLFVLCAGLFVGVSSRLSIGQWIDQPVNIVTRVFLVAAVLAVPILGVRTAVSVTEEKSKQTLLSLLTLPVPRRDILWAKLWAAVLRTKWLLIGIGAALGLALMSGGIHPLGVFSVTVFIGGYAAFMSVVGLWLSVRCETSVRAALFLIVLVVATTVLPLFLGPMINLLYSGRGVTSWTDALSPPGSVWLTSEWTIHGHAFVHELPDSIFHDSAIRSLVAGFVYAAAACMFWVSAVRRFERSGRS